MLRVFHRLKTICSILCAFLFFSSAYAAQLSPGLEKAVSRFSSQGSDSLVNVLVILDDDKKGGSVARASQGLDRRSDRIKNVLNNLRNFQAPHADDLEQFFSDHSIGDVDRHWIVPAYSVTMPVSLIDSLIRLDGVKRIIENVNLSFEPPVEITTADGLAASVSSGLQLLNIPALWNRGLNGKGRLVCSFDTGVEGTHPALADKWRGNHEDMSSCWFSVVDPDGPPADNSGHGSHTMGIMVGAAEADTFGVAPAAEWITAGVIDQGRNLDATLNDILAAFEWALNPDGDPSTTDDVPDVILNSWGVPKGLFSPCDDFFADVIDNVEAAGVVTIFAAGNEGPDEKTLRSPADYAATPINTFSVGAVNDDKVIASFSSRGPSSCDINQIKPEVVAPGVSVRSSYKDGSYAYMSGTSQAAPYIAGMVALIRQYNPDATVEEIKYAFIQAADDLGAAGEDNTYGFGLPDASRILDFIPAPPVPEMNIAEVNIIDKEYALPGITFQLQINLTNAVGNTDEVIGSVAPVFSGDADILTGEASFYFGAGGTAAVNLIPYEMVFNTALYHGCEVVFALYLSYPDGTPLDTLEFSLTVGVTPPGSIDVHNNGVIELAVSDFGQFGFAPGSIYNVNKTGLRYKGSDNLLYEAGLIIGRNSLLLSNSIRDSIGKFEPSDFKPTASLSTGYYDSDGGYHFEAGFTDTYSLIPIPINVSQETITYTQPGEQGMIIFKYNLVNSSVEKLNGICFGFFLDLDLSGTGDLVKYDSTREIIYQEGNGSPLAGLVALKNIRAFRSIDNGLNKTGFGHVQMYEFISSDSSMVDSTQSGDMIVVVNGGAFTMMPGESVEFAFALIAGETKSELFDNAQSAKNKYGLSTDIEISQPGELPDNFELYQNYPNPFNPQTTISFTLPKTEKVSLEIFNTLGQRVKTLHAGYLTAGNHRFEWDASGENGRKVASGIYFYRLQTESFTASKKMTLLK